VSLDISAGQMVVVDETVDPPVIVFDSSEKLFNCTDLVSGSVSLPARSAVAPTGKPTVTTSIDANHLLGSVHASATHVFGSFVVSTGGGYGLDGLGLFNAAGTYVHYQSAQTAHNGATFFHPTNFAGYTFFASAGGLYLNERVFLETGTVIPNITLSITLLAVTFNYKLFVGTLT
jgi:hypothetical protein